MPNGKFCCQNNPPIYVLKLGFNTSWLVGEESFYCFYDLIIHLKCDKWVRSQLLYILFLRRSVFMIRVCYSSMFMLFLLRPPKNWCYNDVTMFKLYDESVLPMTKKERKGKGKGKWIKLSPSLKTYCMHPDVIIAPFCKGSSKKSLNFLLLQWVSE